MCCISTTSEDSGRMWRENHLYLLPFSSNQSLWSKPLQNRCSVNQFYWQTGGHKFAKYRLAKHFNKNSCFQIIIFCLYVIYVDLEHYDTDFDENLYKQFASPLWQVVFLTIICGDFLTAGRKQIKKESGTLIKTVFYLDKWNHVS